MSLFSQSSVSLTPAPLTPAPLAQGTHHTPGSGDTGSGDLSASVVARLADATIADPYRQQWNIWHTQRIEELTAPHGYLAPVSITWLGERDTVRVPRIPGVWHAQDDTLYYVPASADAAQSTSPDDAAVTLAGEPITAAIGFRPSLFGEEALGYFASGELRVEINSQTDIAVRDRHRFWIRVKDPRAQARAEFQGIPTYPVDPAWRIPARFRRAQPGELDIHDSVVRTVLQSYPAVGTVEFDHGGAHHSLVVCNVFGHVTVFFSDETSGRQTYAIGRVLHLNPLHLDDLDHIDFNYALNYPCAFSRFCTCPIPSKRNHLPFAVTAGEKTPISAADYAVTPAGTPDGAPQDGAPQEALQ